MNVTDRRKESAQTHETFVFPQFDIKKKEGKL